MVVVSRSSSRSGSSRGGGGGLKDLLPSGVKIREMAAL